MKTVSETTPKESQPIRQFVSWGQEFADHFVTHTIEEEIAPVKRMNGIVELSIIRTQKTVSVHRLAIQG